MNTFIELLDLAGAKKGEKAASIPIRIVSRLYFPFLKRYQKKGGKIEGEGKNQLFEKFLGEETAKKTVQHMIDHMNDEAKAEVMFSGNNSSVADIHQTIELLEKFV